jgi:HEAT repeat protein
MADRSAQALFERVAEILMEGEAPALYGAEKLLNALNLSIAEPLAQLLYDEEVQLRRNAAWLLRKYGAETAVDPLIGALYDTDKKVRSFAAIALGVLEDTRAVQALMVTLRDAYIPVRLNAVRALGQIGDQRALNVLLATVENDDEDTEVQAAAVQSLGKLGNINALDLLFAAMNDPRKSVHVEAGMAMARMGEPALDVLINSLRNGDENNRRRRCVSAMALGWMVGGEILGDKWKSINRAVEALVAESGSDDRRLRYELAQALGMTGDLRAIEPLVIGLRYDVTVVRRSAAKALKEMIAFASFSLSAIVPPLIEALDDADADVRYNAIAALGKLRDPRAIEPLFACLQHPDPEMAYCAVSALANIGDPQLTKPLCNLLREDDPWLRRCVAMALGKMGHPRAVKPLIYSLRDPEPEVRRWAAISLGQIGDQRAAEALYERLDDAIENVRLAAREALLGMGID